MTLGAAMQWTAFVAFSLIGLAGALGMATTMSMFRSGIFLMASFIGVAGLFILLMADLLALLQIMMYVGGMLIMILFMVLFSHDPGGAMMAGMDMAKLENFFSRGIKPMNHGGDSDGDSGGESHGHGGGHGHDHKDHHHEDGGEDDSAQGKDQDHGHGHSSNGDHDHDHGEMDMSMTTPVKRHVAILAAVTGIFLSGLLVARPHWAVAQGEPNPNSAHAIGTLLMGKYMMAFEGAGLLILLGIFGAVWLARPDEHHEGGGRRALVAADEKPNSLHDDQLEPELQETRHLPELVSNLIHDDARPATDLIEVPERNEEGDNGNGHHRSNRKHDSHRHH